MLWRRGVEENGRKQGESVAQEWPVLFQLLHANLAGVVVVVRYVLREPTLVAHAHRVAKTGALSGRFR